MKMSEQGKTEKKPSQRLEKLLALAGVLVIVIAYFIGLTKAEADLEPFLERVFPGAGFIEQDQDGIYRAWESAEKKKTLGFIGIGTADGYGGELKLAVAVSMEGEVLEQVVIEHKETVSFFRRVIRSRFLEQLKLKNYSDSFVIGSDIDGVTGATYTSRALADCVKKASRQVASQSLDLPVIKQASPRVRFGLAEGVLLGLFLFGLIARMKSFKPKSLARWISMLVGIGFLGFVMNKPFTLVLINKMLLGFWPQWQLELYWYILLGGIVLITLIDKKNPYCEWFCPFGATQECIGKIGGTNVHVPNRIHNGLRWLQRIIALTAIVLAMIFRNPSLSSYEVFGAFFRLIGTNLLFILLAVVLTASLFIRRPWCSYLCPLRPVTDFFRLLRK